MDKKTLAQVFIIILVIIISLSFYLRYFKNSSKNLNQNKTVQKTAINKNNSSSYIENIDYISSDVNGNKYQVTAEVAEIKIDNPDVMFLKSVTAYVFMKNSSTIKIISNLGKFNSKNYDTFFSKNVIITYPDHKITGEYLDFSFLNNLGSISVNVIYNGDKTNLFADKIDINLTTKDTKVFMNDKLKKVLVKRTK